MTRRTRTRNRRNRRKHTTRSTLERSLRKTIEASIRKSLKKLTNRKMKKKKRKTKRKKKLQRGGAGSEPVGGISATTPATTNKDAAIASILNRHATFKDTEYSASTLLKKVDARSVGGLDADEAASLSGNITPKDVIGARRANGGQGSDDTAIIRDFFERGMVSDDVSAKSLIFGKQDEGYWAFIRYVAVSTAEITAALVALAKKRQLAAGVVAGPAGPPAPEQVPEPVPSAGDPSGRTADVLARSAGLLSRVQAQQPAPAPVLAPAPVAVAVGGTTCDEINKDITLLGAKIKDLETEKEILERDLSTARTGGTAEVDNINRQLIAVQAELKECNRKKALLEQELTKLIKELYCSILAKVRISRLAHPSAGIPQEVVNDIGLTGLANISYESVLKALLSDRLVGALEEGLRPPGYQSLADQTPILTQVELNSIRMAEGVGARIAPPRHDLIEALYRHILLSRLPPDVGLAI